MRHTTFSASGTVVNAVGHAVQGAAVLIYDASNAFVSATTTDIGGNWSVSGLPNGSYTASGFVRDSNGAPASGAAVYL